MKFSVSLDISVLEPLGTLTGVKFSNWDLKLIKLK